MALGENPADTVREYIYKANGDLDYYKDFRDFTGDEMDYIKKAYELNGAGLTTKITYTDYSYDNGVYTDTKKEEYTLTYDDRGYITAETAYTNYGAAETVNKSYTYDTIGRLTQAVIGNQTKNYTYDNVGNRTLMSDGTNTFRYTYNQFNQLQGITDNYDPYASYTYDSRGNQTQEQIQKDFNGTTKTQTTDYTYNLLNVMTAVSVTAPGETSQSETNVYNAAGQRVKKLENGETTKYYYSGSAILYTTNAYNYLTTENILDLSGAIVASARFDDQNPNTPDPYKDKYFFYNYDERSSVTKIIQPDGTPVKGYMYDEFGKLDQSGASDFLNEVTYTSSVSDKSTGLQYMNARYYNPATGRFLSQDTYSGNPYDPWTQHLYSYCGNNPTNMVDPTGHDPSYVMDAGKEFFESGHPLLMAVGIGLFAIAGIYAVTSWVGKAFASSSSYALPESDSIPVPTSPPKPKASPAPKPKNLYPPRDETVGAPVPTAPPAPAPSPRPTEPPGKTITVYRAHDNGAGGIAIGEPQKGSYMRGHSWTTVDPRTVSKKDFRSKAGIPDTNTMTDVVTGRLAVTEDMTQRQALPLGPYPGKEWPEILVPDPSAVDIIDNEKWLP